MVNCMYGYILNNWHIPEGKFACSLTENQYFWHPAPGIDDELEISLMSGSNIAFTCYGEKYFVPEGTVLCCNRSVDSPTGESIQGQPVHIDTICIRWKSDDIYYRKFTEADFQDPSILLLPCFLFPCPEIPRIERIFKQYIHHSVSDTAANRAMCISLWYELVSVMDQTTRRSFIPVQKHTSEYYVKKLDYIIETQYHSRLHITDLAAELGVSPNYLSAVYSKERGQRFSDTLLSKRMECAKQLLVDGKLSMQEIAEAVGFSGETYLRQQFHRYYGVTPAEFLRIERELTLYMARPIRENMELDTKNSQE
ncbi:MAG: helix-turn-helix transcriptional regulator [Clostridia bacterium]|nr:helix-turn-helix transcriptional regulator [Clostridia bacterium]